MSHLAEIANQSKLHNLLRATTYALSPKTSWVSYFSNWAKRVGLAKRMSLNPENSNITEYSLSESLALSEQI